MSWTPAAGLLSVVMLSACVDTAAVQSVSPAEGATGIALRPTLTATFNVELDPASVTASSFTLVNAVTGAEVAGTVQTAGKAAKFTPSADLTGLTQYTATIDGAKGKGGPAMKAAHSWSFTTAARPLAVVSTAPATTGVAADAVVSITFDAPVNAATVTTSSFTVTGPGGAQISGTRAVSGATLTFTPTEPWAYRTDYTVTATTAIQGAAGEVLASNVQFTFKTASGQVTSGIGGRVTFDAINADDASEGGPRLDYANIVAKPARRVVVEAWEEGTNLKLMSVLTNDDGDYKMLIPDNTVVKIRAYAWLKTASATTDTIAPDHCNGASWDVRAVDNTQGKAQYGIVGPAVTAPATSDLHAATTWTGTTYGSRNGAPFFLVDNALSAIERVCESTPAVSLPVIYMNWSPNNVAASGDKTQGQIITSHYTTESGVGNLYILGKEDSDTDEYDDHVVVHEFGHYLEDKLYRSDSIGGPHSLGNVLDPRVAFGEGYGNAMSGIVTADPVYVDTSGNNQATGFSLNVSTAPTGNDRGVYSETSMQFFLYSLWENRDALPVNRAGNYDRINTILAEHHKTTEAFTNGQTFAAYYNQRFGDADGLYVLYGTTLDSPTNALCVGTCSGSATADPWDTDNDLGTRYASTRTYASSARDAEFWRLYKPLTGSGFASPGNGHDKLIANSGANKFGMQRWYRYTAGATANRTFTITNAITTGGASACNVDYADLWIYDRGEAVNDWISGSNWEGLSGGSCETLDEPLTSGRTYVLTVSSYDGTSQLGGWGMTVQ